MENFRKYYIGYLEGKGSLNNCYCGYIPFANKNPFLRVGFRMTNLDDQRKIIKGTLLYNLADYALYSLGWYSYVSLYSIFYNVMIVMYGIYHLLHYIP